MLAVRIMGPAELSMETETTPDGIGSAGSSQELMRKASAINALTRKRIDIRWPPAPVEKRIGSVIDGPQIRLTDGRVADHRYGRELSLPVRRRQPLVDDLDLAGIEPARDDLLGAIATHQPVEDLVRLGVRDAHVSFVGLSLYQIGARRFRDYLF